MSGRTGAVMERDKPSAGAGELAVRCGGIEKSFGEGQARVKVLRGTDFEARAG